MNVLKLLVDKTKEAVHNKYLQEVHCSCCGSKGKIMNFRKMRDGSLICKVCLSRLPLEWNDIATNGTLEEYNRAMAYARTSRELYEPVFCNDAGYGTFEVDSRHLLFRNSGEGDLIFPLANIDFYNFTFHGDTAHDGLFGDSVTGNVHALVSTSNPDYHCQSTIAYDVKAKAHKKFLSNTYVHGNPTDLDEFILRFDMLMNRAKEQGSAR